MAEIHHEIKIKSSPERISEALTHLEALQAWHGGIMSQNNDEWRFEFADGSTFRWKCVTKSPGLIIWQCVEGPGDSVGTEAAFALSPFDDGRTIVEFVHRGWPGTHGNYRKCNTRWAILLHHLQQYVETGTASPALR